MAPTARETNAGAGGTRGTKRTSGPTRERLLAAARESFANRGFASTRVADIVGLAGTSHGTFYTYFEDKRDVLLALTAGGRERDLRGRGRAAREQWATVSARRDPRPADGFLSHLQRMVGRCSDLGSRKRDPSRGRRAARAYQGVDRRAALPPARTRSRALARGWRTRPRNHGDRADRDGRGIRWSLVRAWPHTGDDRDRSADGAVRRSSLRRRSGGRPGAGAVS